jgi:lysophospholipase L1-like esterase
VAAPEGGRLRVTTGADGREEKVIAVRLACSGELLGSLDLRFAHAVEPFELPLSASAFAAALREGVRLSLERGSSPCWLFAPGVPLGAAVLAPHLLPETHGDRQAAFFDRLASLATLQTFGWMEGCVLDALHDLRAVAADPRWEAALQAHLAVFGLPVGPLVYEDPKGRPADGRITGIEDTLPFAVLAKREPQTAVLDQALTFWREHTTADQAISDGDLLSAEGSYTVAYPLAVLASGRYDAGLAALAATQVRLRRDALHTADGLWLRRSADGVHTFRWWARGVAWYLLGLIRSLEHLRDLCDIADLQAEVQVVAEQVLAWQRADGLWGCFLDDPASGCDTSGSAGIAAALARAAARGWLAPTAEAAARRTWQGLLAHLTPDGLLGGAAQSNRGGEALQRGPYRVLSPMGMGLMGQLTAALGIHPGPALPRVFVIGDSISIQYGEALARQLTGIFRYERKRDAAGAGRATSNLDIPTGANGGDSAMVLDYLRHRQATAPIAAEVVLLNCGLHDIKTDPVTRQRQVDPESYERNLREIIASVAAQGATLIWIRTTPVFDAVHNGRNSSFHRYASDLALYNGIADRVMTAAGITMFDLHGFSQPHVPEGFCDHVHYRPALRDAQALFLAEQLRGWWQART